jgi:hypothetical protein
MVQCAPRHTQRSYDQVAELYDRAYGHRVRADEWQWVAERARAPAPRLGRRCEC